MKNEDCSKLYLSDIHKKIKITYFLNILKSFIYNFIQDPYLS